MDTGFSSLLGVVIGGVIAAAVALFSQRLQWRMAKEAQIETRRTQRHEYLIRLMDSLVYATYRVESLYGRVGTEEEFEADLQAKEKYASAMGRAAAVCLATGHPVMKQVQLRMTPYLVKDHRNTNRACLHEALEILAGMINELTAGDVPKA